MPTIDLQYDYPAGSNTDPNGHNNNMYKDPPEQGVLSSANGHLELPEESGAVASDNYGTALGPDHFHLGEYALFERFVWEEPVTIYDDTAGGSLDEDEAAPSMLGIRFRVPAFVQTLSIDYSFFLSCSRLIKVLRDSSDPADDRHKWDNPTQLESYVAVYWNGTEQTSMRIPLPRSLFMGQDTNGSLTDTQKATRQHATSYEHLTAQQYSDGFLAYNVIPGTYSLQFRVHLENPGIRFELDIGKTLGRVGASDPISVRGHQRSTFGCGSVTVVGKNLSNTAFPAV